MGHYSTPQQKVRQLILLWETGKDYNPPLRATLNSRRFLSGCFSRRDRDPWSQAVPRVLWGRAQATRRLAEQVNNANIQIRIIDQADSRSGRIQLAQQGRVLA